MMSVRAMNFKMDEAEIQEMKRVAGVYHMTVTNLIREVVRSYISELKDDPFYRLTANVQEVSAEESEEILSAVSEMTDDDLTISSTTRFSL